MTLSNYENGLTSTDVNPFFLEYNTPFHTPPFDKIEPGHFMPAFEEGMKQQKNAISAIVSQISAPDFENTIVALETSGELLTKVCAVFFNLASAHTSSEIEKISQVIAPKLSGHGDDIYLNADLFSRIKTLNEQRASLNLTPEQARLLEKTYKAFVRSGANLDAGQQVKMREINKELSVLTVQFGQNLLAETNLFEMIVEDEAELSGLPASLKVAAANAAKNAGQEGAWKFSLHNPSIMPFLQYAENRELRRIMFEAYINRCNHQDERDNKEIVSRIATLRAERAHLLGYTTHADFVLEESMAKTPDEAVDLLIRLWNAALPVARYEASEMQQVMDHEGENSELEGWDWSFYADKVRKQKYNYDAEALRPYFKVENVRDGIFKVAQKLYGLTFTEIHDIPKYHPDVIAYEVKEADGTHTGIFYIDLYSRTSKRGGAWMTSYRKQSFKNGVRLSPVVSNVCNFARPAENEPALLTPDEVETFFHEFGHALHGLLSDVTYETLSGTSVPRDFVELPSQIMEHWAFEPEVLQLYATHYETDEVIPNELVEKMKNASRFNQGFGTVEYLAASFLDMGYHTIQAGEKVETTSFENKKMEELGLIRQIPPRYRSTYFQHIFSGGYSAGYYSYIWSEVLDSDAFSAFLEAGNIFDPAVARSFRTNILSKGGTEEPMTLYKAFRGREPEIKHLLKNRGLDNA